MLGACVDFLCTNGGVGALPADSSAPAQADGGRAPASAVVTRIVPGGCLRWRSRQARMARKQAGAARKQASGFKWHQDLLDVGQVKGRGGRLRVHKSRFLFDCVEKQE